MFQSLFFFLQSAPPAAPQGGASGMTTLIFLGIALAVIYFLMIRPQNRIRKQQTEFASSLKKGKRVVTVGGLHGTIAGLEDKTVVLIIAPSVHITVQRDSISMDMTNAMYGGDEQPKSKEAGASTVG